MADSGQKPFKIAWCIPTQGITQWESFDNLIMFAMHLGRLQAENPDKYEFYFGTVGRVSAFVARNRLTEYALEMDADFMLQVDDDMIVPLDMFERLFKTMQDHNADIVAPLAFMRYAPHDPVIFKETSGYDAVSHKQFSQHEIVRDYPKNDVLECDAVGFGTALIRMSMVKRMIGKSWFLSTVACGEDVWFCRRAKAEAHAKIMVDTRVKLGHLGAPNIITEETFDKVQKERVNA